MYRFTSFFRDIYNEIKYFIQRGYRGYSDRDNWDIDYFLVVTLPPMIRYIKENGTGYPARLKNRKEWEDILEAIIQGFEAYDRAFDREYWLLYPEDEEKYKKGMKLFIEYFSSLGN